MLDRPCNAPDNTLGSIALQAGDGMLCLAPHPDDEVLGCAGLMMLAQRQGLRVHTIIASAGEQGVDDPVGDAGHRRLAESHAAARTMGLPPPVCWHLADRQLRHSLPLIQRIEQALRVHQPRWLLLPALTEPHPDHQALALAGMAAAQRHQGISLLFYEVGAPTQPNTLVDITAVADLKWKALEAFASQEERHAYREHAQAMSAVRAFVAADSVLAAEAYWHLPANAMAQDDLAATLGGWPLQRNALQLASSPQQLPLVSIIIRSMNRPSLADAIASVAAQTYPHIEVVVVNATGQSHPVPAFPRHRLGLRVVGSEAELGADPEGPTSWCALNRSGAANLGLQSMQGELGLFLDDDDLLQPLHIQNLVQALQAQAQAVAAYSGVRVEGRDGQWLRNYDAPWQQERLWGINYLPIHAVLFRRSAVLAAQAQFDEQLPVMEDWDFWCQLSHQGGFVRVPGIGATYRQGLGTSQLADAQHANYWAPWHRRILEKHARRWGLEAQSATLAWHALALDRLDQQHQQLQEVLQTQQTTSQEQLRQVQEALQTQQTTNQEQLRQVQEALQTQQTTSREQLRQVQEELIQSRQQSAHLQALHTESQEQLQLAQLQLARLQEERDLSERSLHMLQHSLPVRWSRTVRRLLGGGR